MERWENSRKSSKSSKSSSFNRRSNSEIIPDFQIFGSQNDLLFYGDDEELYANPRPSTR